MFSELTVLVSDKKSPMSRRLSCSCFRRICRFNLYASGALAATYVEEHFRTVTAVFLQSPCLTTRATAANYWGNLGETQSCMCMCAEEVRVCKILNMNCDFEQKKVLGIQVILMMLAKQQRNHLCLFVMMILSENLRLFSSAICSFIKVPVAYENQQLGQLLLWQDMVK